MKRFLKFSMAAILALGFWSCVSEEPMEDPSGDAKALQFTIKQPVAAFVTRADIATSNEWNIATLDVYAVEDGGTANVAKLTENTDYTMAQDAATHTFTITMSDPWLKTNGSKTMNFYFVGNDKTSNSGGDGHAGLTGTKKEAAFKDALTDNLTAVKVAKPNGTTQNLLFSTMVQVPNITGTVKYSGMLKRREARFDIEVNEAFADVFKLTKVEIGGTYQNGMIFGVGDATKVTGGSKGTTTISSTDLAYNAKANGSAVNNAVQSAFYTYPLSLNESNLSAGDRSYITIFGVLTSDAVEVERAYPVTVPENTPIQANFRYILRMDNPAVSEDDLFGSVSLVAVDYEEGETFNAEPGAGKNPAKANIQIVPENNAGLAGVFRNNTMSLTPGFEQTTIAIVAESQYGVILNVTESRPGSIQISNMCSAFTRGVTATDAFQVIIPTGTTEFEAFVDIISTTDPKDNERIKIYRASAPRIEAPYILYMDDKSGALSAGKWDNNKVRTDNMAYFKFGSVIGFNNSEAEWPADGSAIMFNPSAKKWATDMTAYAPESYNAATSNALPNIPGYVSGDHPKNVTVESGYVTVANVRAGKGDPCMLVGYTANQIAKMTDSELQDVLANAKLRLPTRMENRTFAGSTSNWASRWSAGTPGMGTFGSYKLPALGRSGSGNGVLVDPNTSGDYWSSEVRDAVKSFYLDFTNSGLHPEYDQNYSNGATIRCVENESPQQRQGAKILYMEKGGVESGYYLKLGEWGDEVTIDNIAYFKFGSVVGFLGNPTSWDNLKTTMFTPYPDGNQYETYNPMPWSKDTQNKGAGVVQGYNIDNYPKNVTVADGYVTVANFKLGKGDPCMLVGHSDYNLFQMSDSELQAVLDNAEWRLPTDEENIAFAGDTSNPGSSWIYGNPGMNVRAFGDGSYKLPAAGSRNHETGALTNMYGTMYFWSSTVTSNSQAKQLYSYNTLLTPSADAQYSRGSAVRCVPNVY